MTGFLRGLGLANHASMSTYSPIAALTEDHLRIENILIRIERVLDPLDIEAIRKWLDLLERVWTGHRRREILFFQDLSQRSGALALAAGTAAREHAFEAEYLKGAQEPLRGRAGDTVPFAELVGCCRALCGYLREHLQRRARHVFPRAAAILSTPESAPLGSE